MRGVNKAFVVGNVCTDIEANYTKSGTPVCNFRVATDATWYDKDGEKVNQTTYHRVAVFNKLGETCIKHLQKKQLVYIEGRMQENQYIDTHGIKRSNTTLVANDVVFLGPRPRPQIVDTTIDDEE